ncbi:MAG: acyl-CoA thioester hydrolase/BAAT C-terminal domain-containing protein [Fimbriimonadaceae bacterium]
MAAISVTEEITFKGATDLNLSGEMMTPRGDGPFPCVLLLPGSGPTDRDGNQPPAIKTDLLKQIAESLATNGIATFRFDKRPAHKNASQWPKTTDMAVFSEYFSFENHVADVEAAYKAMVAHAKSDDKRCGLLGHSEGGLFVSWVAARLNPKAIVLAGTAGQTMEGVLRYQIGRSLSQPGVPEALRKEIGDSNEATMKAIIATGKLPEKVHPNLAGLYNPAALKLLHSYLTIDPIVPLAKYAGPALVMNGEKDVQVRADVDATRLYEALKSRKETSQELFIVPGASHNLKEGGDGFVGPVAPAALDRLSSWLARNLR